MCIRDRCYIVDHFLVGKEKILLQHVTDASRCGSHILIFQIDLSFIRWDNTGKHIEQCGLSGTADSQKGNQLDVYKRQGLEKLFFFSQVVVPYKFRFRGASAGLEGVGSVVWLLS